MFQTMTPIFVMATFGMMGMALGMIYEVRQEIKKLAEKVDRLERSIETKRDGAESP